MDITKSEHPKNIALSVGNYLPHVIKKRINKTGEGRSGDHIYKRRNNRSYRVLLQYFSWLAMKNDQVDSLLDKYDESYIVSISPEEYFGDNYPNRSPSLHADFILNQTGFIYYTSITQFNNYPPTHFDDWIEVFELSTVPLDTYNSWIGEYALNIRNTKPSKVSIICGSGSLNQTEKDEVKNKISNKLRRDGVEISDELQEALNNLPAQRGIGNYDYDYASKEMIRNVKRQMISLIFLAESNNGLSLPEYIKENYHLFSHNKDTKTFLKNLESDEYVNDFNSLISDYIQYCEDHGLLEYDLLIKTGVWKNVNLNSSVYPICPLCSNEIFVGEFFTGISQIEGRISSANTQREIVLMHIDALQPLKLNHRTYNLGWGHNYCNLIQGDRSIKATIELIEDIVVSHRENN